MVADEPVKRMKRRLSCCAAAVLLGACQSTPPVYRWGVYEDLVYAGWKEPGSADPVSAAQRLEEDLLRTETEGGRVPPGVNAHLGYLRLNTGDTAGAADAFRAERALFPESATLMDSFLARLGAS